MIRKKYKIILIILIFLIAVLVRTVAFGKIPGGFNQDGAMAAVDAKALADTMCDRLGMFMPVHFTAWGFGQMSVLLSYAMVPFIKLFGLSSVTARLPMLIFSIIGLIALYMLSKKAFNEKVALVIFAFAAINPWHIMQSRWALDCNLFPHVFLIGVTFLAYRKPVLSMIFFALSMYCYGISIYCVPFFLVVACAVLLKRKEITVKKAILCVFVYLAVAWPFILCMIINAFSLETIYLPFCTIPYFENSVRSSDILFFAKEPVKQLWSNFVSLVKIFFQISHDPLYNEIPGFGTMYLISWPFFIIGLYFLVKNRKKNTSVSLVFVWFITAVFTGLVTGNVNINRINIIFYPLIIITGAGLCLSAQRIKKLGMVLIPAYAVYFCLFTFTYFTDFARSIKYTFLEDFGEALTYASSLDADKVYVTPNSQAKGRWYVSEILAMYYCDDYSSEKYDFWDKEGADVLILDEPEPDAVQFGRFYVVTR